MIETINMTKYFDQILALDHVSATIKDGSIFGLVGTNGAGKSTFLRVLSGILTPDEGEVIIDGEQVYENKKIKENLFYISDDQYFIHNATPEEMRDFYHLYYKDFSKDRFNQLLARFGLEEKRKIKTFSKGMKKQLSVILGISSGTKYIFCDETFDGLDPVMRQGVKSIFSEEVYERNLTPIIASHNLRELEDISDTIGLLHRGGILLEKDLDDMKLGIHKVQCAFVKPVEESYFKEHLDVVSIDYRGNLITMTARGDKDRIMAVIGGKEPLFQEVLPLSLEEIFIVETEVVGYDIKSIFLP